jgi:asparagine synthase (glutamine-hydrolysing)
VTAIAGLWRLDGRPDAAEACARMLAAQELYGPHAVAQWSGGDFALGRRLMRALPEDCYDRQPLVGGGGRYVLVADIRLDNRDELIETLQIAAADARSLSDAAILLVAIEKWDDSCLEHLIGDYAFALWDLARRRLILARDPLGQRPLHYHRCNKFLAFASMPKGLHALPEIAYAPDEERIAEFLVLLPETGSQSFFLGVERVEPGHVVTVTATSLSARRHWQPTRRRIKLRRPEDYGEALRNLLDQAVRCRLRGAEDVGAHLSGGLDSGAVAATAARLLAPSGRRVVAFTAVPREGYDGRAPRYHLIDEGPFAAAVAALYPNIEHVLIRPEGRSLFDDLDRSFFLFDRPSLNICNMGWGNSINDAARTRKLTVLLGGDAGNMGLSYDGSELLPELLRRGQWLRWWQEARTLVVPGGMRWRGVLANTFGPWCPPRLWVWLNKINSGHAHEVTNYSGIHPRRLVELDLPARAKARNLDLVYRPWKDGFAMRLWALQRADPGNYNKGFLGGWQIDYRDPTADVRLLEFCLAVPTEQFFRGGVRRALAKRTLADRLPKVVLEEPRKGLQAADWHEGLAAAREQVAAELDRLDSCPPAVKALDLARLRRLVEDWPIGGWERDEIRVPYRLALLRAISTGHFLRRATRSNCW